MKYSVHVVRLLTCAALVASAVLAWRGRVRVIPVELEGTTFPEIFASDMTKPDVLPRLDQRDRFPAIYRDAAAAVARRIEGDGLVPGEYYVEVRVTDSGRELRFELWHQSVVVSNYDLNQVGDPSHKCRTARYDSVTGEILAIHGWR